MRRVLVSAFLLANKESLVLAGDILIDTAKRYNSNIMPVDSEHSAIFQCLQGNKHGIAKIELTASGGPFLNEPLAALKNVKPEHAYTHPNWQMGRKISVDSATMMNKGLEIIEAHYLFNLSVAQIGVVIHPQSIVHALVHYQDGSALAQLGLPDMRTAISYALFYPQRQQSGVAPLDLTRLNTLSFYPPDLLKFRCLSLVMDVLKEGKNSLLGALNAANEIAVAAFLANKIGFLQIADVIDATLQQNQRQQLDCLKSIMDNDAKARKVAKEIVMRLDQ